LTFRSGKAQRRQLQASGRHSHRRHNIHETHVPTFQAPPGAQARLPRPHANGWRPPGAVVASRQGPRSPFGLTRAPATSSPTGSRAYRLRGTGAFDAVFRTGRRFDGSFLQLVGARTAQSPGRVGYVISRKSMPRAVDRNRLRRLLRETVRAARPAIAAYDVILRVKRAVGRSEIDLAAAEGERLVRELLAARP
jgi:ribonuclease P protein component